MLDAGLGEAKIQRAINEMAKAHFNDDPNAWRRQRNCMRFHLFFDEGDFEGFEDRLNELNRCLKYFPIPAGRVAANSFDEDELAEIIDRSKPIQYQQALLMSNYDPYSKSLPEHSQHLERLEASSKIEKVLQDTSNVKTNEC